MGVSPACIAAVIEASGGKFETAEAAELIRSMEALKAAEIAAGKLDGLDARVRRLAAQDADRARIAAAQARRHAALAAVAYDSRLRQVRELVAQGRRHDRALLAVFEGDGQRGLVNGRDSVQATRGAYLSRYLAPIRQLMLGNDRIRKLVETGDTPFADRVTREMGELRDGGRPGVTQDADALALARAYAEAAEQSRLDRNRFGGSIGRLEGWRPQSHDSALVAQAGREAWIAHILPRLDVERSFGPNLSEAQQRRILAEMFDHIAAGLRLGREAADPLARIGPANLANRLGAARELHFRDTEAWLQYRARFGQHHVHGAMAAHLQRASRDAALLEQLGPNPLAMLGALRRQLAAEAMADTSRPYAERVTARNTLTATRGPIDDALAEASGLTSQPVNSRWSDIMAALRNQQRAAKLAGALLSQVTDLAVRAARLTFQGEPILASYARSIGVMVAPKASPEIRALLASVAAGADGMRSSAWAEMLPEDSRPGVWSRIADMTFRLQGQEWWTDRLRGGTAYILAEHMGRQAGKTWSGLDPLFRRRLENYGVTGPMWEAIRPLAESLDGRRFITPDMARAIPRPVLAALARPQLEMLQKGLAETIARRAAADAQEAGWLSRRTARFDAELARAQARMEATSLRSTAAGAQEIAALRLQIDTLRTALSDLAEFQQALAEGRTIPPPADPNADVLAWRPGEPMPPDVALAEAQSAELAKHPTHGIMTPERQALRQAALAEVESKAQALIGGPPAIERQALIVIGPPSAGKSTIIEPLAKRMRALLVDPDDLKAQLPEFDNGMGAMRVHEESSLLAKQLRDAAMRRGMNLALPTVGDNPAKLRETIETLKAQGYRVTLVLNHLPIEKAMQRNMIRFRETGRLVGTTYLMGVAEKPTASYELLQGIADEHARYSNDVPRGSPPLYGGGTRDLLATEGDAAGREPGRLLPRSAERDAGPARTAATRPGTPREEAYLASNSPPEAAALRMEGELRHRLDRLRRAIGRVRQQAVRQDIRRLEDFEAQWARKAAELDAFVARVEQRGAARRAANLADTVQWDARVAGVLEDTRRDAEMAFRRYYADEMLASTLEPDAQSRRFLLQGTQPGTRNGELLRAVALFKSFPVAYAQRVLAAAVHGFRGGERGRQVAHIGGLLAASTLLGYLAMSAKDAVRGYAPRDPTHYKTWLAAMAQGGGIGIYGDFLFGQGSRFGNSPLETMAGPALGGAANLIGIWQRAKEGDAKAGDALGVVLRETPFVNLWWLRPALDASILNSLREYVAPGTLRRQARQRLEDYGQERWAPETVWR